MSQRAEIGPLEYLIEYLKSFDSKVEPSLEPKYSIFFSKGVWHEIFDFWFFSWISVPQAPSIPLGPFCNFSKIRRDIRKWIFIAFVNDTGDKLFSGVNDTGEKFIAGGNPCHGERTKKPKIFRQCQHTVSDSL